ncbi:DUF2911 domain-containing protein [Maribacter sp. 2210JD10-5]|uniref:DUF2911 domain-containing protein n=1 Tax=Maribacter sp. 2210JD10-5 TaxID=3386272 RepID=UPI0039BCEA72
MKDCIILLLTLSTFGMVAQTEFPSLSPLGSIEQKVGITEISIAYERPIARGRTIFGELVPFGTLWRTGAGNGTKIKFDDAVVIDDTVIPAGQYSLFTIPNRQEWTIILNNDATIYGLEGYDETKNVIRFKTKANISNRYYESFTLDIDLVAANAELNISWENTRVTFQIKTQTDKRLMQMVKEEYLSGKVTDSDLLATGADYYYFLNTELETALKLINRAIDLRKVSWYYDLKIDLLTKRKQYKGALQTLKTAIDYVKTNPENWTDERQLRVSEAHAIKMKDLLSKIKN